MEMVLDFVCQGMETLFIQTRGMWHNTNMRLNIGINHMEKIVYLIISVRLKGL